MAYAFLPLLRKRLIAPRSSSTLPRPIVGFWMSSMTPETDLSLAAFSNRLATSRMSSLFSLNRPPCSADSGNESLSVSMAKRTFSLFEDFSASCFDAVDLDFESVEEVDDLAASLRSDFPFVEGLAA